MTTRHSTRGLPVGAWAGIVAGSILLIGVAVWLILQARGNDAPAEPTSSPTPSVTPSPSPSPSPSEEPRRIVSEDDHEILERLMNPTTGEVWHEPIPLDEDLGLYVFDDGSSITDGDRARYWEIGTRGDATIVALVETRFDPWSLGHKIHAVFELDQDGARFIACPSARVDALCVYSPDNIEGEFDVDEDTFYDTVTLPKSLTVSDGLAVRGWSPSSEEWESWEWGSASLFGEGLDWPEWARNLARLASVDTVTELPGTTLAVVRLTGDHELIAGVTGVEYGIRMPHGGLLRVEPDGLEGFGMESVTWDDGRDTFTHPDPTGEQATITTRVTSVTETCFAAPLTELDRFIAEDWVPAGTTAEGYRVYLPAAGGNEVARTAYEFLEANSWGAENEDYLAYPHDSYDEFLDARSLFTFQLPDGTWIAAMDSYASQRVYECA